MNLTEVGKPGDKRAMQETHAVSDYYEISPARDELKLGDHTGAASFSVRYVGQRQVEARANAVPMQRADDRWMKVEPPAQFDLAPGQTQMVKVAVAIPSGVTPGRYGLRLDVASVDNPDEEYARGPLVTFYVEAPKDHESRAAPPDPQVLTVKHQAPRWAGAWFIFVATLALIILGLVLWVLFNMPNELGFASLFGIAATGLQIPLVSFPVAGRRKCLFERSPTQPGLNERWVKADPWAHPGDASDA